jgi:uncharacterized membrane protein
MNKMPDETTPLNNRKLIATDEGRILIAGMLLFCSYLGVIVLSGLFFPKLYEIIMAVTASHIIIGRVPGITVAYAMEGSFYTAVGINFVIETMLVLFLYPLFIMSWNKLLNVAFLERWIGKGRKNAEKYQPLIEKYGMVGLFAFVWFPFWMTGPIVGSFIGYLMGFRHRTTLAIVLIGTLIAISCWGIALQYLQDWAFSIDPRAPWIIVGFMAALITLGFIIRKLFKR